MTPLRQRMIEELQLRNLFAEADILTSSGPRSIFVRPSRR
jgi:hypothetical protein